MPRDGLSQYAPPPGTNGITNYTIESTKYNGFVADVTQDLNLPRPIVAGGTGANNARDAMTSLQGDVAYQVVTNYDSYAFVSGSFYSAAGATSAPTANAFIGQCYTSDPAVVPPAVPAGQNMFIEARDVTTGLKYLRQKTAGVWAAWKQLAGSTADLDAAYVNVSGDTMAGPLNLVGGSHWSFASPGSGSWYASNTAADRFFLGSDATGDTFRLYAAGASKNAIAVDGATTDATFGRNVSAVGTVTSILTTTTGTYYFGNTGTKYLSYDGSNYFVTGGNFQINGTAIVTNPGNGALGQINFGNSGTKYLSYDGSNYLVTGGNFQINGTAIVTNPGNGSLGQISFGSSGTKYLSYDGTSFNLAGGNLLCSNTIWCTGHATRTGVNGAYAGNFFNIMHGTGQQLWIDTTQIGTFAYTSDYRIKKDVIDLPGMWDVVKQLRPIKYTQAQFTPPSHIKYVAEETLKARKEAEENPQAKPREVSTAPLFEADDIERWGFIAHELQATLTPSASSGVKDSPDTIQSPNPFTLIAALTKALQEAMARIEALEAR
jgi:hypothetical protein